MPSLKQIVRECLLAVKSGDMSAFDKLYDAAAAPLYYAAYDILHDRSEAENVLQDTFIAILNNLNNIDIDKNAWSYMVTAVKNKALNAYNKRRRTSSLDEQIESGYSPQYSAEYDTPILDAAKIVLSDEEYRLVTMCCIEQFTLKEAGAALGIPLTTAHFKYKKALQKIKEYIIKEDLI